jgi:putative mRNA 3-end processing factor
MRGGLLKLGKSGIWCEQGGFHVDPWRPVDRAVITHAHGDHARWGMGRYLCAKEAYRVMRRRLGEDAQIDTVEYGESVTMDGVSISLHPAGHILGSAQVRVEKHGRIEVVSGDYKTDPDPTCSPYESVRCHRFVTESTFGLPIYRWPDQSSVYAEINEWWRRNQEAGKCSLLLAYALGKAQRALAGLDPSIGPIWLHGAVNGLTQDYRAHGVSLASTKMVAEAPAKYDWSRALVIAPPGANGTPWARKFGEISTAFVSGWMLIRGARRRRAVDRGFVLSDHVDWPSLMSSVEATGAEEVWVTHGYSAVVARYLTEKGIQSKTLETEFEGEQDEPPVMDGE